MAAKSDRGQSSIEYMVMLAMSLGIFAILLYITSVLIGSASSQIGIDSAYRTVEEIREAVDFVYIHGHPSKTHIKVYMPTTTNAVSIAGANSEVVNVRLDVNPSYTDVYAVTRTNLTGDINTITREGYYTLNVASVDGGGASITIA